MTAIYVLLALRPAWSDEPAPAPSSTVHLELGPVRDTHREGTLQLGSPDLTACATHPLPTTPPPLAVSPNPTGQITFEITLRRGRVDLVTVSQVDPAYAWLAPCLQRQLATYTWPVKKGILEVPVAVEDIPATDPATPADPALQSEPATAAKPPPPQ